MGNEFLFDGLLAQLQRLTLEKAAEKEESEVEYYDRISKLAVDESREVLTSISDGGGD